MHISQTHLSLPYFIREKSLEFDGHHAGSKSVKSEHFHVAPNGVPTQEMEEHTIFSLPDAG